MIKLHLLLMRLDSFHWSNEDNEYVTKLFTIRYFPCSIQVYKDLQRVGRVQDSFSRRPDVKKFLVEMSVR